MKEIAVVTGGNGFVGSHLVDFLLEQNFTVRCITRKSSDLKWLKGKDVEIIDSGLFDKEGLRKAFAGASYLYHVAGVVKSKRKEGYFKGNVETTRTLLETAVEFKDSFKKILIVSSQTAGGPSLDGEPVDEAMEPRPITTYGRSKLEKEKVAKQFMNELPITICRAPAVYGERDTEILIFFKTYHIGIFTTIGLDIKRINLIHVKDLVRGLYLATLSERTKGEIYFIGSEKFYTWEEIGNVTEKSLNRHALHIIVPHFLVYGIAAVAHFFSHFSNKAATLNLEKARDITQKDWICSSQKAFDHFGYKQEISLEEGIKRTVAWYKEMKWI
jgi:nucleoside-diphosphate-sugar epimerase